MTLRLGIGTGTRCGTKYKYRIEKVMYHLRAVILILADNITSPHTDSYILPKSWNLIILDITNMLLGG